MGYMGTTWETLWAVVLSLSLRTRNEWVQDFPGKDAHSLQGAPRG